MARRYTTSELADQDMVDIGAYIGRDNLNAALRLIDRFEQTFERLAQTPGMGRRREELASGLRSFPVGNYVVFYRPIEDGIEVVRVLHGARNIENLFKSEDEDL